MIAKSCLCRCVAGVMLFGACCAMFLDPARASIFSVTVSPPNPTAQDSVRVAVLGGFGDGCWSLATSACGTPAPGMIAIDAYAHDGWEPGTICVQIVPLYDFACDYGPLAPGHYLVIVTEYHDSLREPLPSMFAVEFDVSAVTPNRTETWSRLKAAYR